MLTDFYHQINHHKYLIAFSGGIDSTALLSLLANLRQNRPHLQLRAVHIHHGLNPKADSWAEHCQHICTQLNVPLIVKKVQINSTHNIEQQAREARYQAIAQIRQPDEIVVTAHHLQDQSETFLLALKRGSGIKGLSAMQPHTQLYGMPICRPLLNWQKSALQDYLEQQGISWIEDDSNTNNQYDRNFLRNQILPELRQRWQHFDQAVARSAKHCFEQQQLINELLAEEFSQNYNKTDHSFNISSFKEYSINKQNALIRMWLEQLNQLMPDSKQLAEIIHKLIFANQDANPQFCLTDKVIRRYQGRLYLTEYYEDLSTFSLPLNIGQSIELPNQLGILRLEKTSEKLTALWQYEYQQKVLELPITDKNIWLRFAYSGKVKLHPQDLNRNIKKVWQKFNIPPWQRQRIPLIFYAEQLQGAVGLFRNYQNQGD